MTDPNDLRMERDLALTRARKAEGKYNTLMSSIARAVVKELRAEGYIEVHTQLPDYRPGDTNEQ